MPHPRRPDRRPGNWFRLIAGIPRNRLSNNDDNRGTMLVGAGNTAFLAGVLELQQDCCALAMSR